LGVAGISRAICDGAVTLRIVVAEVAARVTDVGDTEQDAGGVDPFTAQVSCTALLKEPFTGAMLMTSVIWPPRWTVRVAVAGVREKSGGGLALNVAVTLSLEVTVMLQFAPEQPPLQPENVKPASATALKVTRVPAAKLAAQVLPQSIPAGLLVTRPLPVSVTERVKLWVPTPPSITVTLLLPVLAT